MQLCLFCTTSASYLVAAITVPAFPHSSISDQASPATPKLLRCRMYTPLLSSCPGFLPQVFVGRKHFFLWYLFVCQAGLTPPELQQLLPGHCPGERSQEGEGGSRPCFPKLFHTKDFRRLEKL